MLKRIPNTVGWLILCSWLPSFLAAQAPEGNLSAEVTGHVEKAKKLGGAEWAAEAKFFCLMPRANSPTDPLIEPTRIFDNVYAIGRTGTVVYAITTPEGIILIDAGYANEVESVLLAGMTKLGLDPAKVKYVIVTHGHADHFGGAPYFQEHYGAHIALSQADWDLMLNPPPPSAGAKQGKGPAAAPVATPKKDLVAAEGQAITLEGEKVVPVFIPGHTPGSMGLIFDVMDGGKRHVAALFGGTILTAGRIPDEGLRQYLNSIEHFKQMAKQSKVDVELQNHPLYDGFEEKLTRLRERKAGAPNPFVVGQANYGKFLDIMTQCTRAEVARRAK